MNTTIDYFWLSILFTFLVGIVVMACFEKKKSKRPIHNKSTSNNNLKTPVIINDLSKETLLDKQENKVEAKIENKVDESESTTESTTTSISSFSCCSLDDDDDQLYEPFRVITDLSTIDFNALNDEFGSPEEDRTFRKADGTFMDEHVMFKLTNDQLKWISNGKLLHISHDDLTNSITKVRFDKLKDYLESDETYMVSDDKLSCFSAKHDVDICADKENVPKEISDLAEKYTNRTQNNFETLSAILLCDGCICIEYNHLPYIRLDNARIMIDNIGTGDPEYKEYKFHIENDMDKTIFTLIS